MLYPPPSFSLIVLRTLNKNAHGVRGARGAVWANRYATLAVLAGTSEADLAGDSGPVPPDSVNLWPALRSGSASPRVELVHNINGNWSGALRVGDYKLLRGHPNEAFRGTDDWSTATPWDSEAHGSSGSRYLARCQGAACPCVAKPCLFQVGGGVDPEERHDLAGEQPARVQARATGRCNQRWV